MMRLLAPVAAQVWRRRLVVVPLLTVLCVIVAGWFLVAPSPAGLSGIGGPFRLIDGDGHIVTDRDLRGKFALVYFGYTFCPDVCPTTLGAVTAALDALGPQADQVRPVFITVDPQRDTPKVVRDYAAAFSPRLLGLTGSPEAIDTAARAYRVYYGRHPTGNGPNEYTMDHSSILYLMGPDGGFRGVIPADDTATAMAADIKKYL